ncbi:MAG TPA: cupredoxin domain-containing protein [Candidatus Limnocylindria bacterium]|jgi:hypothetical protein
MTRGDTSRPQRRRSADEIVEPPSRWRYVLGGTVVAGILATGVVLGFGDFLGRPGGAQSVRMSMAGFEPRLIHAAAGEAVTLDLWTTDSAIHLESGVHTIVSDELGIREELPAESRKAVTLRMPAEPGTYDIYCDSCCGGKDNPTMHGRLHVAEA